MQWRYAFFILFIQNAALATNTCPAIEANLKIKLQELQSIHSCVFHLPARLLCDDRDDLNNDQGAWRSQQIAALEESLALVNESFASGCSQIQYLSLDAKTLESAIKQELGQVALSGYWVGTAIEKPEYNIPSRVFPSFYFNLDRRSNNTLRLTMKGRKDNFWEQIGPDFKFGFNQENIEWGQGVFGGKKLSIDARRQHGLEQYGYLIEAHLTKDNFLELKITLRGGPEFHYRDWTVTSKLQRFDQGNSANDPYQELPDELRFPFQNKIWEGDLEFDLQNSVFGIKETGSCTISVLGNQSYDFIRLDSQSKSCTHGQSILPISFPIFINENQIFHHTQDNQFVSIGNISNGKRMEIRTSGKNPFFQEPYQVEINIELLPDDRLSYEASTIYRNGDYSRMRALLKRAQ